MDQITTHRKETYGFPRYEDAILRVSFSAPSWIGRERQHLIEEKIDKLFGEVSKIIDYHASETS